MENILNMSIEEMHSALKEKKILPSDLVKASIAKAKENQETYNAFVTILDEALEYAYELDENFEEDNVLYGIPYAAKDNFSTKDILSTGSSNILKNYVPVFDATSITKLNDKKMVLMGKTVLDELAMGGTGLNGHTGPSRNPYDPHYQSGGSSGGSAVAVSLGIVPFALGSDTGDSVRKPASLCGVVGFKPTWGRISRFGVFPFAPSLDHVAYFTRTVKDSAYILEALAGVDYNDATSSLEEVKEYSKDLSLDVKGKKIAVIKEIYDLVTNNDLKSAFENVENELINNGASVSYINFDIQLLRAILPVYMVISCAEATSNDANLDGIKFGPRENGKTMDEEVFNTRTNGFSELVKRRFVIGSYCLSKKNQDKLFIRAQRIRRMIVDKLNEIFNEYDAIMLPASGHKAPLINSSSEKIEKLKDEYLILESHLALANFGGLPSLTLPLCMSEGMPIGLNITCKAFDEQNVFDISAFIESKLNFKNMVAKESK